MSSGGRTKAAAKRKQAHGEGEENKEEDGRSDQGDKKRTSAAEKDDEFGDFKIPKRRKGSDGHGEAELQREDSPGSQAILPVTEESEQQETNTDQRQPSNNEPKVRSYPEDIPPIKEPNNLPRPENKHNNKDSKPPPPSQENKTTNNANRPKAVAELKIRRHELQVAHSVFHAKGRSLEDIVCRLRELDGTADNTSSNVQRWRQPVPDLIKGAGGLGRGRKKQKQEGDTGGLAQGTNKRQKGSGSGRGRSSPVVIEDEPPPQAQEAKEKKNKRKSATCPVCGKEFTVEAGVSQEELDERMNEHANKCIEQQEEELSQDAIRNMTPPPQTDLPLCPPTIYANGMAVIQQDPSPHVQRYGYVQPCINPAPRRFNHGGYDPNLPRDLQGPTMSPSGDAAWECALRTGPPPPAHPVYDPTAYQMHQQYNHGYGNGHGYGPQVYGTNGRGRGATGNRPLIPQPGPYPR